MTETIPDYVQAAGNVQVAFAPAVSETATAVEVNAGVMLACYSPDDWEGLTAEAEITEQTRMCLRETFEVVNRIKRGVSDLNLTYLPQQVGATTPDAANEAYDALTPGTQGFLVVRYGKDAQETFAADDVVDVQPVEVVTRTKNPTASQDGGPLTFSTKLSAKPGFREDVKLT